MSYIGIPPQANFSSGLLDRFTSTTGTTVTLTHDIASENDIVVFVNFVKQDSTTYSVGGTGNKTLTLGGTLVSSDIVEVHYLNIVGQTNAPSSGSVGSSQLTSGAVTGAKLNTDVISAQTELASGVASTDELLISDAGVLKRVDVSLVGGNNTPAFLAYQSSGQVIADTTDTTINFQTEVYDTASAFASNTFTCPSGEGGKYNFFFSISKDNFSATRFNVKLTVAGTEKAIVENASGGNYDSASGSVVLPVSEGDAVLIKCYQDSSGSNNLLSGEKRTFFGGYKIIE